MDWISVEEKEPRVDDLVLFWMHDTGMGYDVIQIGYLGRSGRYITHTCPVEKHERTRKVTHWMPLPEPPDGMELWK